MLIRPSWLRGGLAASGGEGGFQITAVSGSLTDGGTVNVTGSGFDKPDYYLLDYISNISSLNALSAGATVPVGSSEEWNEGSTGPSPETRIIVSHSISRGSRTKGYQGTGPSCNIGYRNYFGQGHVADANNRNNQKLYVRYWQNINNNPVEFGGSNKFMRVWNHASSVSGKELSVTADHTSAQEGSNQMVTGDLFYDWPAEGSWRCVELYINGPAATVDLYVDGVLTAYGTDYPTAENGIGLNLALWGFDVGGNPTGGVTAYNGFVQQMTDLYMATDQSRWEITTSSTYARGAGEVQDVQSTTGTTGASLKICKGNISNLSTAYLHKINADGTSTSFALSGAT